MSVESCTTLVHTYLDQLHADREVILNMQQPSDPYDMHKARERLAGIDQRIGGVDGYVAALYLEEATAYFNDPFLDSDVQKKIDTIRWSAEPSSSDGEMDLDKAMARVSLLCLDECAADLRAAHEQPCVTNKRVF